MRERYIELIIEYISKEYDEDLLCSIHTFTKYTVTEQKKAEVQILYSRGV